MARVAGNSRQYRIAMLDTNDNVVEEWGFDSVTTVLDAVAKPSLMHWYYTEGLRGVTALYQKYGAALPSDFESIKSLMSTEKLSPYSKRNAAANRGRDIHDDLERLAKGLKVKPCRDNEGLLAWWDQRGLTKKDVITAEKPLVSFKYRIAGTPDLIYRDPESGKVVLTDLKTGKYIVWTHFLQGETYREMWLENNPGSVVDKVSVLHVRPPGEYALAVLAGEKPKVKPHPGLERDGFAELVSPEISFDTFLSVLHLYRTLPEKWHPEDIGEKEEQ